MNGFKSKPRHGLRPLGDATDPEAGAEQPHKRGTSWNIPAVTHQIFRLHFIELSEE
jgi:hypothetical protein